MPTPSAADSRADAPAWTRRTASTAIASPRLARRCVIWSSRRPPPSSGRAVTATRRKARPSATGADVQRSITRPAADRWTTAMTTGAPSEPGASARTRASAR